MIIREIQAKSIVSKSGIDGVSRCVNPYIGCAHGCAYCYASFMKRYTGHREPWGSFVDVKTNSAELLAKQIRKARGGNIFFSTVTDPYQPVEKVYRVTRSCLEVLSQSPFSVDILTKSPLVLRDLDVLKAFRSVEVGISITTDSDAVRREFEPNAPTIEERIEALRTLHTAGVATYAFIGPVLPMSPEILGRKLGPYVHRVLIDRMNYPSKTKGTYCRKGHVRWLDKDYVDGVMMRLRKSLGMA